jgi:UDP-N-acetylmuramoyl-L-alanyl-D-glutamate--2,6-diaminopimelate ligase
MLRLSDLFLNAPDLVITGLSDDSRKVKAGEAFVAVPGAKSNGMAFAAKAVENGAVAIIGEVPRPSELPASVVYWHTDNARHALSVAATKIYPRQPQTVVAITGTSGKSSVADFVRQIFAYCGHASASLGTLGVITSTGATYGSLTTPGPLALHQTLDQLAQSGITHLAMEASSHGIDQRRLDGVRLEAAAFTNLGRDHLDYHGTVEAYRTAKLRLFDTLLPEDGAAVINADGLDAKTFINSVRERHMPLITTGYQGEGLTLLETRLAGFSQHLVFRYRGKVHEVLLPLAGAFQVENALVAAGLALATGEEPTAVFKALESLKGVSGRLERVAEVNGALCIVDYAHKPEALDHALRALRPFASGKLICVFGCGGDRDTGKRPIMGHIAAQNADLVIVTDDNPRSENPASIRSGILQAARDAQEIPDRAQAIVHAVNLLQKGDVLIVAGKGHETGQIIGDQVLPFSDQEEIVKAVASIRGPKP